LQEEDQTSKFGREGFLGFNVDGLKQLCRDRHLQVSGTKFDLVLRILHCDNGTTPEGQVLKRAATDVVKTTDAAGRTVEKHVAKKRKKPAPSASKAYDRVAKKINAVTQKKYQSHWGSKTHSTDVYSLVATLLDEVIAHENNYLETDPRFALTIAESAITSLTDNFGTICRPGYDDDGGWSSIDISLRRIVEAAKPHLTEEECEDAAVWIEEMHSTADAYGLMDYHDFLQTCEFLRGAGEGKSEEKGGDGGEDKKPSAAAMMPVSESVATGKLVEENDKKPEAAATESEVVNENVVNPAAAS